MKAGLIIFSALVAYAVAVFKTPPLPAPAPLSSIVRTNTYHLTVVLPDSNPSIVYLAPAGQTFTRAFRATNSLTISNLTALPSRIACAAVNGQGLESDYSPDAFLGTVLTQWGQTSPDLTNWTPVWTNVITNGSGMGFSRMVQSNWASSFLLKPD